MSKKTPKTPTTEEPPTPPLEDRVRADYADFLVVLADKYQDEFGPNMYWPIETAPLSAVPALKAIGQRMRSKVKIPPRPPLRVPQPETDPPRGSQRVPDTLYGSARRNE